MYTNQQSCEKTALMWLHYSQEWWWGKPLHLRSGHFKKIIPLLCNVLHPSNFSFSGQPYKLVAISCYCWLLYRGFWVESISSFCASFDFFKHLLYSHWQHTIRAFHIIDNLAVHFGHTSSALTSQPVWRPSWTSYPTFARNFWESMLLSRRGRLSHPPGKMIWWLTNLCPQNVHDKIKVIYCANWREPSAFN
jgi:hypothetical protein